MNITIVGILAATGSAMKAPNIPKSDAPIITEIKLKAGERSRALV